MISREEGGEPFEFVHDKDRQEAGRKGTSTATKERESCQETGVDVEECEVDFAPSRPRQEEEDVDASADPYNTYDLVWEDFRGPKTKFRWRNNPKRIWRTEARRMTRMVGRKEA